MIDPRMTKLADVLINYATALKAGEKILIEAIDIPHEMTCELVRVAREAGADPLVTLKPEFNGRLLQAAVEMHDRQLRRSERWTYLIPIIWVALVAGLFTLLGSILNGEGLLPSFRPSLRAEWHFALRQQPYVTRLIQSRARVFAQ